MRRLADAGLVVILVTACGSPSGAPAATPATRSPQVTAAPTPTLVAPSATPPRTIAPGRPPSAPPPPQADQPSRPRVASVNGVGDTITVTFSQAMLQIGEGSGVEMIGNYLLDGRALPATTNIACHTRECLTVGLELPEGTLVPGTGHTLRIANVVAQAGPGIEPDPTTVSFTDQRP